MQPLFTFSAIAALALSVSAQVAPGEGLMMMSNSSGSGFLIVDVPGTGGLTEITGMPSVINYTDAGVIDPVTGEIWSAGVDGKGYNVFRMSLSGSAMSALTPVVDLTALPKGHGPHNGIAGMDLDRDGNLFVIESGTVWRIDRHSFAVTQWVTNVGDEGNALEIDPVTNTMWAASLGLSAGGNPDSRIVAFDLDAGPGPGTLLFDVDTSPFNFLISSLAYDDNGTLFVGTFSEVFSLDTATGASQSFPITGSYNGMNSLDFDSTTGLLHTAGGTIASNVYAVIDPVTGLGMDINKDLECKILSIPNDPLCQTAGQNSSVYVNDFLHTTQMFPRVASVSTGFTLEVSANGMPGDFAAIAVGEINGMALASPVVLGSYGICGLGGNFVYTSPVPGGVLPAFITSLGIGTATYDFSTGVFAYGGVETLTLNP